MSPIEFFAMRLAIAFLFGAFFLFTGFSLVDWILGPVLFRFSNSEIIRQPTFSLYTFHLFSWLYQTGAAAKDLEEIRYALQANPQAATLLLRFCIVFIVSAFLALGCFFLSKPSKLDPTVISGIKYLDYRTAVDIAQKHFKAARANQRHIAVTQPIYLAPGVPITVDQETMGIFVEGGTGSGKTIIFRYLMDQAIAREDQLIVFDVKGDYAARIEHRMVVNPFSENTARWNIAEDVRNSTQADEVASMLIRSDGKDADFWSNAGHTILKGLFMILINTKPLKWTFADFYMLLQKDTVELALLFKEHYPMGSKFVTGGGGGMEAGTVATVAAYVRQFIEPLAMAWGNEDAEHASFSIFSWLSAGNGKGRVLVLQCSPLYLQASAAWIRMVLNLVAGASIDPITPEYGENRIWVFLDELPTLGFISRLNDLVDKGRSKGYRTVMACQSLHQLNGAYAEWAKSVDSSVGIRIYSRINPSERSYDICRYIGEKTRRTRLAQVTKRDGSTSTTIRDEQEKSPVITPEDLVSLGTQGKKGVDAISVGLTPYAFRLNWPYPKNRQSKHPAYKPAKLDETILRSRPANPSTGNSVRKSIDADLAAALDAFDNQSAEVPKKRRK